MQNASKNDMNGEETMKQRTYFYALAILVAFGLSGCQTDSSVPLSSGERPPSSEVNSEIKFFDIKKFDHDLYHALKSQEREVSVVMYEKVSPNNTPDRIQKWLNSVEKNGGKVEIEPPANELVPRNPFVLIGMVGSLWDAVKAATDFRDSQLTQSVKGHDAVIVLERNPRGEIVVGKVTFKKNR